MAEETEKAPEREPTVNEVTRRLEAAKLYEEVIRLIDFGKTRSVLYGMHRRFFDAEYRTLVALYGSILDPPFRIPYLAVNANDLTLAAETPEASSGEGKSPLAHQVSDAEEVAISILISSAIADVERAREAMRHDEEEIQRLKEETRAVLAKLAA